MPTTELYTLSLHDALPIYRSSGRTQRCFSLWQPLLGRRLARTRCLPFPLLACHRSQYEAQRSEEHTSELQSLRHLVCRLLLEKKKNKIITMTKLSTK